MLVGLTIDPKITAYGVALFFGDTLVLGDRFDYKTRGSVSERSMRIAGAFCDWLKYEWVGSLDWLVVEDQIIRPRSPYNQAIMTLKSAADTATAFIADRFMQDRSGMDDLLFTAPEQLPVGHFLHSSIWRPLPEAWKGSMSKQSTEMHLLGNPVIGRPGRLRPEELTCFARPECYLSYRQRTEAEKDSASDVFDAAGMGLKYLNRF